jgi:hypothetical protein
MTVSVNYADFVEGLRQELADLATASDMLKRGEMTVSANPADYLQWAGKTMTLLELVIGAYEEEPPG